MAGFTSSVAVLQDLEIQGGCVTFTNASTDIDLIDNNASALSFDSSGKEGILEVITTNCSEGVAMSGTLDVTGITTIGSCGGTCGMGSKGLRIDGVDGENSLLVATGDVVIRDTAQANKLIVELCVRQDAGTFASTVTDFEVASSGDIDMTSTNNAACAIYLRANGGTSETIKLHADQGNGTGSICLTSDVGGITLNPATFITIGGNSTNAGEVRILEDTDNGSNYVALKAPNVSTSYTITLPTAVAAASCYVLTSTCAGVTSWAAAASGGVSLSVVVALS